MNTERPFPSKGSHFDLIAAICAAEITPDQRRAMLQVLRDDTPPPSEPDWIPWSGGLCPVPLGTPVQVRYRSGNEWYASAGSGGAECWIHFDTLGDIVAYRVLQQPEGSDWKPWQWGICPVAPGVDLEMQFRDGRRYTSDDVTAYRVIKE